MGKRGGYLPGQENLGAIRHQPATALVDAHRLRWLLKPWRTQIAVIIFSPVSTQSALTPGKHLGDGAEGSPINLQVLTQGRANFANLALAASTDVSSFK